MPTFGRIEVFDEIYKEGFWGDGSGGGSAPSACKPYVKYLQSFIARNQINSIVDLGCGDWQFMRYVNLSGIDYTGIDAAKSIIDANASAYGSTRIRFIHFKGDYSIIPKADLLVCKDVLQHLDSQSIREIINLVLPRFRFSLVTNDVPKCSAIRSLVDRLKGRDVASTYGLNKEIELGDYRLLDLRLPPFYAQAKVAIEWDSNPWPLAKKLTHPKAVLSGEACEWRKRTLLVRGEA